MLLLLLLFCFALVDRSWNYCPRRNFGSSSCYSPWTSLFRGFCVPVAHSKAFSSSLFIRLTFSCTIILIQVAKFFCSIKSLFNIHLAFQMNNLKLNYVVCFTLIYALTNKLIIALFAISNIKITGLKIWFVCFGSKSSWSVFTNTGTV